MYYGVEKTIKLYSEQLTLNELMSLEILFDYRESCKNYFYSRFSGIEYLDKLNFRDIRDSLLVKDVKDEMKKFHLPARTWKMDLSEAISNIKTMWSNMETEIKHYIRNNENLTDEDRHYLFYVLKSKNLWAEAVQTKKITETKKLSKIKISKSKEYLINLLCRYTRMAKPKISVSRNLKSIQFDTGMYDLVDGILSLQTQNKGQRLLIKLRNKVTIKKGDIRIVLNRDHRILEVHKLILVPETEIDKKEDVGLDKGYTKMFSSSSGKEYGIVLGDLLNRSCDFINKKNKARNYYHSLVRNLEKELKENKKLTDEEQKKIKQKIERIKKNNLSDKTYKKHRNRHKEIIKSYVNHEIKRLILTEHPSRIALEDLTFESVSKGNNKHYNRKMNLWIKGYIDERINYYAKKYDIEVVYVSAAYTSQFCSICGARLDKRTGIHNEIGHCPNCGEIDANINAAKNIKARLYDSIIQLYTPYKKIEKILLDRYEKNVKRKK